MYNLQIVGTVNVCFEKGIVILIGSFYIIVLFGNIDFYIVDTNILFLLSLENINYFKVFYNNIID